jgi:outer membrane lipoprotein-sorting protein
LSKLRIAGLLLLAALIAPAPALAALSAADHGDVARAEAYLNAITALSARFLQVAPDGSTSEGSLSLLRPGHLRLDYDPPSPIVVFADSNWLVYRDKQLDQTSYVDIDSTPAGLLIKPQLSLESGGLAVTGVAHRPGVLAITVIKQSDPRQGRITLIFSEQPFQLRQWHVVDAQGQTTTVSLFDPHTDAKFETNWFSYRDLKGF